MMNDDARKKIFEEFKEMIRTETVVGQPIYLDDATIKNATPNGTIDRVLNMIPEAVSHFTKKKEKKNEVREAALKEAKEAMKEEAETAALEAKVQNR